MPQYKVRGPDGRVHTVNAPKGASQQDAIAYVAGTLYTPAAPAKATSTGEKAQALASSFVQATGGLLKDFGMLGEQSYVPVVKGTGIAMQWLGERIEDGGEYIEPEALAYEKARQAARVTEEAGRPGAMSRGVAKVGSALEDVPLIGGIIPTTPEEAARAGAEITTPFESGIGAASFIGQQLPATLASITPAGAARSVAVGATKRAATAIGREASEAALRRAATVGATVPSAGINAASAGRGAYESVIAAGGTEAEANEAYREAFAGAAAATGVAGVIPGMEQRVAGATPTRGVIKGAVTTTLGEVPQEFIEEAGSQYAQNVATQGTAAEVPLGQGVLTAGALGAIGGGMFAGPTGAIQGYKGSQAGPEPVSGGEDIKPGVYTVNVPAPGGEMRRVEYTVTGVDPATGMVQATSAAGETEFDPNTWKQMVALYGAPIEPAAAPTEPTEPVEPVEPVAAAPAEPIEPVAPTEPTAPATPAEPIDVTTPVEPTGPASVPISAPVEPIDVTAPAEPEPTEPLFPIEEPLVAPPKLPMGLAINNPQHKGTEIDFRNDIDRALYMATSQSKDRQRYIDWLASEGYADPNEVKDLGTQLRKTLMSTPVAPDSGPMQVEQFAAPRVLREAKPLTQEQADKIEAYDPAFVKGVAGKTAQEAIKFAADRTEHPYYRNILGRISAMMTSLEQAGAKFTFDAVGSGKPIQSPSMAQYLSKKGGARGAVSSARQSVSIGINARNAWNQGGNQKTFVHEMVHAVTVQTMYAADEGRIPASSEAAKAVVELDNLYKTVRKFAHDVKNGMQVSDEVRERLDNLSGTNFFANSRELIAWGLSQYDAQQLLKAIPVKKGNAFTEFVRIIGRMIGINPNETNALQKLIEITEKMLPADQQARADIAQGVVSGSTITPEAPTIIEERARPEAGVEAATEATAEPAAETQAAPEPAIDPDTDAPFINIPYEETIWDKGRRIFVNDMRRLGFTEEMIEKAFGRKIPWGAKPTEAAALYEGRANQRLDDVERDHFKKIMNIMKDRNIDPKDADMFLYARAAKDRNAKIAARNENMPDGGSGMFNSDADQWMDMFVNQGQYAALEELGQAVDEMVDATLATRVAYGLLSQEQATALREAEPHYIPMKGLAAGGDITVEGDPQPHAAWAGTGLSITPREYRKAKGRTSMPFSPLANAMVDARAAIVRGEKNRVGQKFLNEIVRKYDSNAWKEFTDENPERDSEGNAKPMAMLADRYFVVKENGKPSYIRISDPLLMRAMTKAGSKQVDGFTRSVINVIRTATVIQSKLFTTLNPEFAVTNFARDVQAAVFNMLAEQDKVGGRLAGKAIIDGVLKDVKSMSNIRSVWKSMMNHTATTAEQQAQNALFLQAKEDGAFTGWIMTESPAEQMDKIKQEIKEATAKGREKQWYSTRDGVKRVVQKIEDFNSIFENVTRFSVYKRSLEAGLSRDEAANMARNVTVDFNKKGEVSSVANALFAFFNATMRGHAQLLTSLVGSTSEGKRTRAQKLVGGMAALGALQVLLGAAASGEDDDGALFYDKISDEDKARNLIIMDPIGGERYLKIPLPYGYSFFHKFGADTTELVFRDKSPADYAIGLVSGLRSNFSPLPLGFNSMAGFLTSLTPTVSKPFFDLGINENYFGSPIYNEPFDEKQSLSSVSRYSTPEGYKAVAEFLNDATGGHGKVAGWGDVPAEGIKYLIDSYTGGTGKFIFGGLGLALEPDKIAKGEVETREIPFVRKVLGSPNSQADLGTYFERTAEMGPIVRQLKDSSGEDRRFMRGKFPVETNPAVIAAHKSAQSQLKDINKQKKLLMNRDSTPATEAALERLEERQHDVYIRFNRTYNKIEERER